MTGVDDKAALELSKAAICRSRLLLAAPSSTWAGWIGSKISRRRQIGVLLANSCSPSSLGIVCKAAVENCHFSKMMIFEMPVSAQTLELKHELRECSHITPEGTLDAPKPTPKLSHGPILISHCLTSAHPPDLPIRFHLPWFKTSIGKGEIARNPDARLEIPKG